MPTFDGKTEKFELFEDLFQKSLKIHNQLTEDDRINYFHSLMRGDALQTLKNINGPTRQNLEEILAVFRRKYVKHQSMATAKHKFQKLVFNPANQKLVDFLDELLKLAKDAFGIAAHAIIEQFIYAKMPPHLKKSINQAHLENGTYEQIVTHLERELELNGLEAPDELPINNVSQKPTNTNAYRPEPTCHHCKKPGHYRNQCRLLKKQREQTENDQNNPGNKNSDANTSNPNSNVSNNNNNKNSNRAERKPKTVYPPCETCGKTNHSTEKCYFGANAANRPLPRHRRPERQNQISERANQSDNNSSCSPKFTLTMPRLHSGAATDRPETTHLKLPPIPEVVWQQPQETDVPNIYQTFNNETHKNTHMPESQHRSDVELQTSPIKQTSTQVSVSHTEPLLGNQTRSAVVPSLNDSKKPGSEIQRNDIDMMTWDSGDDNISPPAITISQIEERLVRDDSTNELYMPLSSTIVLKRKKEMLYVPLDFENGLTIDALVDSGAYVSAIAQKEHDGIKQQSPSNILKIDDPPNFQIQVANGQLEKPTATATLKFDIGDHIFAEHFVVMKNLTGPIIGWHFMRHNSVVIDTTHGIIHFPHLTMQVKSALSQTSVKPQAVLIHDNITIPQMTTKTITAFVDHVSEWNTTGTVTPVEKFTENASLIKSHSMSTTTDRIIAVRVTNTTESPYTINKNTQIAEFSVVTPEQSKFIKPVDMAVLSMIPEGDPI